MESIRQQKVARLLLKELSRIFQKESQVLIGNAILTITKVHISPDLYFAKIYISIFPIEDPKSALQVIASNTKMIRRLLGQSVRDQLRIVPELQFYIDDSAEYADEIERLLRK